MVIHLASQLALLCPWAVPEDWGGSRDQRKSQQV